MEAIDWEEILTIDEDWVRKNFIHHFDEQKVKLKFRAYSIKMSGSSLNLAAISDSLAGLVTKYVFSQPEIEGGKDHRDAQKYFGHKDPNTDGKYGELFLFALVESVLKCPMVAHKIRTLTNPVDQVKGGDGIFLGKYRFSDNDIDACLIGESKIMADFSSGVKDALDSLDRFHTSSEFFDNEFIVARDNVSGNVGKYSDAILEMLKPGEDAFNKNTLVHPVFIMYNTAQISTIEKEAVTNEEAEEAIQKYWESRRERSMDLIESHLSNFPSLQKVILDFFLIPVNDVEAFRNQMYYQIHGVPYKK